MKITELRLAKLFIAKGMETSPSSPQPVASFPEKLKGAIYISLPFTLFSCFYDICFSFPSPCVFHQDVRSLVQIEGGCIRLAVENIKNFPYFIMGSSILNIIYFYFVEIF